MDFQGDVIDDRWQVNEIVKVRTEAIFYNVTDTVQGDDVIMKVAVDVGDEVGLSENAQVLTEAFVINSFLHNADPNMNVAQPIMSGTHRAKRFVVMKRYIADVDKYLILAENELSVTCVLKIAIQLFETMWVIHLMGFAHTNIDERHVMSDSLINGIAQKVFLVDFTHSVPISGSTRMLDIYGWFSLVLRLLGNTKTCDVNVFRNDIPEFPLTGAEKWVMRNTLLKALDARQNNINDVAVDTLQQINNYIMDFDNVETANFSYPLVLVKLFQGLAGEIPFNFPPIPEPQPNNQQPN